VHENHFVPLPEATLVLHSHDCDLRMNIHFYLRAGTDKPLQKGFFEHHHPFCPISYSGNAEVIQG
jgi:hypothetical protein